MRGGRPQTSGLNTNRWLVRDLLAKVRSRVRASSPAPPAVRDSLDGGDVRADQPRRLLVDRSVTTLGVSVLEPPEGRC